MSYNPSVASRGRSLHNVIMSCIEGFEQTAHMNVWAGGLVEVMALSAAFVTRIQPVENLCNILYYEIYSEGIEKKKIKDK